MFVTGLVGSAANNASVRKSDKPKTEILASAQAGGTAVSPPPPLPPRSRVLVTPPPPLPPREAGAQTRGSTRESNARGVSPSHTGVATGHSTVSTVPSATPPSSLEQLAEQTGLTTQQIHDILIQHSQGQPGRRPQPTPNSQTSPPYHESYNEHRQPPTASQQYQMTPQQQRDATNSIQHNGGQPPPPPNYSSAHILNSGLTAPPPPPYNTHHQPSPASSVTSGSSNDYLLMNYGYIAANPGEYRTPAYGESPSSG